MRSSGVCQGYPAATCGGWALRAGRYRSQALDSRSWVASAAPGSGAGLGQTGGEGARGRGRKARPRRPPAPGLQQCRARPSPPRRVRGRRDAPTNVAVNTLAAPASDLHGLRGRHFEWQATPSPHSPCLGCTDSTSQSLVVDGSINLGKREPASFGPGPPFSDGPHPYPRHPDTTRLARTQAPGVAGPRGQGDAPGLNGAGRRRPKKVQVKIGFNDSRAWVLAPSPPTPHRPRHFCLFATGERRT